MNTTHRRLSHWQAPAWSAQFRKLLLRWYVRNARDLPWRNTSDPYAVWISEIMLQQTQVATVVDYYHRFLARFPNVQSLAAADEQEVLKLWSGLGYYRRARQVHAAANVIVNDFAGEFPRDLNSVQSLPGIGRYTAGAIVSFAYGTRAPILEANSTRLFSRLIGLRENPKRVESQKSLWSFAESILPKAGPAVGKVNQSAMELGSLICLPKEPKCPECPVAELCSAHLAGLQTQIPLVAKANAFVRVNHALVLIRRRGHYLMRQNPHGGWWEGLWDFPRIDLSNATLPIAFDATKPAMPQSLCQVDQAMRQELGFSCQTSRHVRTIRHGVTRFRIALFCYEARLRDVAELPTQGNWQWVQLRQSISLPLTSTAEKLRRWILNEVG